MSDQYDFEDEDERDAQRLNLAVVALFAAGIVALIMVGLLFLREWLLPLLEYLKDFAF